MKVIKIIFSIMICFVCFINNSYSKTTIKAVYCVDKNKNWQWLKASNGSQIYLFVVEKNAIKYNVNAKFGEVLWWKVKYSIPFTEQPEKVIFNLQENCKEQYGNNYEYAQPAVNILSSWEPFGLNDEQIAKGVYNIDFNIIAIKNSFITVNHLGLSFNQNKDYMNMSELLINTMLEFNTENNRLYNHFPF